MRKIARPAKPAHPASRPATVGSEVDAHCSRCRKRTRHRVLAKLGGKPSRVECRLCHAAHLYRPPAGVMARAATPPKSAKAEKTVALHAVKSGRAKPTSDAKPAPVRVPVAPKAATVAKSTTRPAAARMGRSAKTQKGAKPGGAASVAKRSGAAATTAPRPEEAWARAMRASSGPPVPYAMSERYEVGQRLKHSTFGEGVVTRLASPTVCEVVFADGMRKLLMAS